MNAELHNLWKKFRRDSLTPDEEFRLAQLLADRSVAQEVFDDAGLEELLYLRASDGGETFVQRCLDGFDDEWPSDPAVDHASSSDLIEIVPASISERTRSSIRTERMASYRLMGIALAVCLVLAVWGMSGFFFQREPGNIASESRDSQHDASTEPAADIEVARVDPGPDQAMPRPDDGPSPIVEGESADPVAGTDRLVDSERVRPPTKDSRGTEQLASSPVTEDVGQMASRQEESQPVEGQPSESLADWRLETSGDVKWIGGTPEPGLGEYRLKRGQARLVFPGGSEIEIRGPAEWEIVGNSGGSETESPVKSGDDRFQIRLISGAMGLQVASAVGPVLAAANAQLESGPDSLIYLTTEKNRAEFLTSRGESGVVTAKGDAPPIRLEPGKLDQVLAQRLSGFSPPVQRLKPTALMARGANGFEARLVLGDDVARLETPDEVFFLVEELRRRPPSSVAAFRRDWKAFCEHSFRYPVELETTPQFASDWMFSFQQKLQKEMQNLKNMSDGFSNGATIFRGNLNLNGQSKGFTDPKAFLDAIRQR